jgi:hypothetical protein
MVNNRTISVELPITNGQVPIYNASQDKFIPGTAGGGPTGAIISGPGLTVPPTATGLQSLVGGQSSNDHGAAHCVVIGTQAQTTAAQSVVIGFQAGSTGTVGTNDVLIGINTVGSGSAQGGVAIGTNASCNGSNSVVIGHNAIASTNDCVVMGNGASAIAGGVPAVVIGNGASSTALDDGISNGKTLALGNGASTPFIHSVALGTGVATSAIGEFACCPSAAAVSTALRMITFCGYISTGLSNQTTTLTLADGVSTQYTLGTVGNPPGLIVIEAQVHLSGGTYKTRAFFQTYGYNFSTNSLVAGTSTSSGDSGTSDWSIAAHVDGSRHLTITFTSGITSGSFSSTAFVRII